MSVAYLCVAIAAFLPYLFVGYAKSSRKYLLEGHNRAPRNYADGLEGAKKRAYWAQLNGFEAFPPFAAAVVIASLSEVQPTTVSALSVTFVVCRFAHGVLYILGWSTVRSLAWTGGIASVAGLFALSVFPH